MKRCVFSILVLIFSLVPSSWAAAEDLVDAVGVKGGFIAYVGCEDGKRLAYIGEDGRLMVQGLYDEPEAVAAAREQIKSAGIYGKVSW